MFASKQIISSRIKKRRGAESDDASQAMVAAPLTKAERRHHIAALTELGAEFQTLAARPFPSTVSALIITANDAAIGAIKGNFDQEVGFITACIDAPQLNDHYRPQVHDY